MSESDIRNNCTELQAKKVFQLVEEGWEVLGLEGTEVKLRKPGSNKWVKDSGHDYP